MKQSELVNLELVASPKTFAVIANGLTIKVIPFAKYKASTHTVKYMHLLDMIKYVDSIKHYLSGDVDVTLRVDSKLVVDQVNGDADIDCKDLKPLYSDVFVNRMQLGHLVTIVRA